MGFSRQEYWSGLPFPSPGDLPNPGIEPWSPALQTDALLSEPASPFLAYLYEPAFTSSLPGYLSPESLGREPAHFSQGWAAHTSPFPPRGWCRQYQGWDRHRFCPDPQLFCPGTLEALSSLSCAEPGWGRGEHKVPHASLLEKPKNPNSPHQHSSSADCLHKLGYLAAQRPSMTPLLQGKIKYTFPGQAGQSPPAQYSPFPPLLSPLVFSVPSFRGLPAKSSSILSYKFLPSAWTSPPPLPHKPKWAGSH